MGDRGRTEGTGGEKRTRTDSAKEGRRKRIFCLWSWDKKLLNENQDRILQEYTEIHTGKEVVGGQPGRQQAGDWRKEQEMGLARQKIENAGELIEEIEQELQEAQRRKKRSPDDIRNF